MNSSVLFIHIHSLSLIVQIIFTYYGPSIPPSYYVEFSSLDRFAVFSQNYECIKLCEVKQVQHNVTPCQA